MHKDSKKRHSKPGRCRSHKYNLEVDSTVRFLTFVTIRAPESLKTGIIW